jgi:hypothetical protein
VGCDAFLEVSIYAILDSTFKLWRDGVYYCRIDEIDVFHIDLCIDKLYSLKCLVSQQ